MPLSRFHYRTLSLCLEYATNSEFHNNKSRMLIPFLGPLWYDYTLEKNARRLSRSLPSPIPTSIRCTFAPAHTSRHLKRRKVLNQLCHTGAGAKGQSSRRQYHTTTLHLSWALQADT